MGVLWSNNRGTTTKKSQNGNDPQLQTNGKLKHKCGTTATEMVEFAQQCDRNVPDTLGQNRGGMRRRRRRPSGREAPKTPPTYPPPRHCEGAAYG